MSVKLFNEEYLTTKEVAEMWKISMFTLRKYIREGGMKTVKLGKSSYVCKNDLMRYMGLIKTK